MIRGPQCCTWCMDSGFRVTREIRSIARMRRQSLAKRTPTGLAMLMCHNARLDQRTDILLVVAMAIDVFGRDGRAHDSVLNSSAEHQTHKGETVLPSRLDVLQIVHHSLGGRRRRFRDALDLDRGSVAEKRRVRLQVLRSAAKVATLSDGSDCDQKPPPGSSRAFTLGRSTSLHMVKS